jgi:hypothetical protein
MNFDSFIITRKSIIGRHLSDIYEKKSNEEYEMEEKRKSFSISKDDSFFKYDDPNVDFITPP